MLKRQNSKLQLFNIKNELQLSESLLLSSSLRQHSACCSIGKIECFDLSFASYSQSVAYFSYTIPRIFSSPHAGSLLLFGAFTLLTSTDKAARAYSVNLSLALSRTIYFLFYSRLPLRDPPHFTRPVHETHSSLIFLHCRYKIS